MTSDEATRHLLLMELCFNEGDSNCPHMYTRGRFSVHTRCLGCGAMVAPTKVLVTRKLRLVCAGCGKRLNKRNQSAIGLCKACDK